ncbi:unnamed protein product [Taenia asiatica]|uniref:Secreted protein n=1 Tax=Taenia asiatica TaxID=60517 RepID=A0A0R3W891_TAEAS|nr:unnamed protein product [Taenia asiatica]
MICRFFVLLLVHPQHPYVASHHPIETPNINLSTHLCIFASHVISQDFPCPRVHKTSYTIKYYTHTLSFSDNQSHHTCLLCTYASMFESYSQPTEPPHHFLRYPYSTSRYR